MSLALNEAQFSCFIQHIKQESMGSLVIRKAVGRVGRQIDDVWVQGRDIQIDTDGNVIPSYQQNHVWMDTIIHDGLCSISPEEILPAISVPLLPETSVLHTLLEYLRVVMQHNFFPAILMAGGSIMALHYSTILQSGGCPIVIAQGSCETGKSTALRVGLSMFGMLSLVHSMVCLYLSALVCLSVYCFCLLNCHNYLPGLHWIMGMQQQIQSLFHS